MNGIESLETCLKDKTCSSLAWTAQISDDLGQIRVIKKIPTIQDFIYISLSMEGVRLPETRQMLSTFCRTSCF